MAVITVRFENSGILSSRGTLRTHTVRLLTHCLDEEGIGEGEISVLYCSPARIQQLNREYREIDKATDVLSFPAAADRNELRLAPGATSIYVGDLAVCLEYAARQAPEFGRTPGEEVALLLVHGFLHLLGWDHDSKAREKAMWARTDDLLAGAPVAPPQLKVRG